MEKRTAEPISIESKIISLELVSFNVETLPSTKKAKLDSNQFAFEFNVSADIDSKNKLIKLVSVIKIYSDSSKKLFLGEIESKGSFLLENYNDLKRESDGAIANVVVSTFIGVILSTTRGFLILKSKGTIIDGSILPLIDMGSLLLNSNSK